MSVHDVIHHGGCQAGKSTHHKPRCEMSGPLLSVSFPEQSIHYPGYESIPFHKWLLAAHAYASQGSAEFSATQRSDGPQETRGQTSRSSWQRLSSWQRPSSSAMVVFGPDGPGWCEMVGLEKLTYAAPGTGFVPLPDGGTFGKQTFR
ncbi:hypothetical protein Bbelb_128560 [Branchiostoma belcheri]|nr:hypothetical protein Bbelb_128560 [Branchiostoma belcheri]